MRTFLINLVYIFICSKGYQFPKKDSLGLESRNYLKKDTSIGETNKAFLAPYMDALVAASDKIKHRYFFPGHSGGRYSSYFRKGIDLRYENSSILDLDLPELDELDNLHSPEGPLLESLIQVAKLFGSHRSWFLVNGSSGGLHIALLSAMHYYRKFRAKSSSDRGMFLIPRDSHKATFDSIRLCEAEALLLPCEMDPVCGISLGPSVDLILKLIDEYSSRLSAVVLTRPSYQGLMIPSESLRQIASACSQRNIILIVDEAHGSHLKFLDQSALQFGAHIVIQSAHKTLNSLSQTAILHLADCSEGKGDYDNISGRQLKEELEHEIQNFFSMMTTTSPNSLLLASLDAAQAHFSHSGYDEVTRTVKLVKDFKDRIRKHAGHVAYLLEDSKFSKPFDYDPLRLAIRFNGVDSKGLQLKSIDVDDILCEEFGIYCELNQPDCITYILSSGINEESLKVLENAIIQLCSRLKRDTSITENRYLSDSLTKDRSHEQALLRWIDPRLLKLSVSLPLTLDDSNPNPSLVEAIICETISIYPPGIPLTVRGEVLTQRVLLQLLQLKKAVETGSLPSGCSVTGNFDATLATIKIINVM